MSADPEGARADQLLRPRPPRRAALRSHQLVVTDDDIAGTFAFRARWPTTTIRGTDRPSGDGAGAWLNYVVEETSIFWWGGIGSSTEHTAFLRLKSGHPGARSARSS